MLCFDHAAAHLFREDAALVEMNRPRRRRPWSYLRMSFESFRARCARHGASLYPDYTLDATLPLRAHAIHAPSPSRQGLVLRLTRRDDVVRAQAALEAGQNVLALLPDELLSRSPEDEELREDATFAAWQLLGHAARRISGQPAPPDAAPWWDEHPTDTPGRLLYTTDALLSDAFALRECYGSPAHEASHEALACALTTYKTPCLRFDMSESATRWPRLTPMQLIGRLHNHGPTIERLLLDVRLHADMQLISPPERFIPRLEAGAQHTLTLPTLPQEEGRTCDVLALSAELDERPRRSVALYMTPHHIEVLPPFDAASDMPEDTEDFARLREALTGSEVESDVLDLHKIAVVPRAGAAWIRSIAEGMLAEQLRRAQRDPEGQTLDPLIAMTRRAYKLSRRSVYYLEMVRDLGNIGAHHNRNEQLTHHDLRMMAHAIAVSATELRGLEPQASD